MSEKLHLTGFRASELAEFAEQIGEPKYRAKQIFKGLHERRLLSFDEMTDLPKTFREKLNEIAVASTLKVESRFVSEDGTRRFLMKTRDNFPVETVFIPTENRGCAKNLSRARQSEQRYK